MEQFWSRSKTQRRCASDCQRIELDVRLLFGTNRRKDTMTQETFPEIQAAAEALEKRINLTEDEIAQMKESIKAKRANLRSWKKALAAISPRPAKRKSAKTPHARSAEACART